LSEWAGPPTLKQQLGKYAPVVAQTRKDRVESASWCGTYYPAA